jgi:sulfide:quinone oxidoreductase
VAARVAIVGAGPGGVAAARRLRDRAGENVEVGLVERGGTAEYLPGTISTLLGETSPEHWRQRLALRDVEVRAGEVEEVFGDGVKLEGRWIRANAVIAAPGLGLDAGRLPDSSGVYAFWDPRGAASAASAVRELPRGTVAVVISSLPYRCPPAPYGMAMQLAGYYRRQERGVRVILTTPEEEPLAAIGEAVPGFLRAACASIGVEILTGFQPDLASLGDHEVRSTEGATISYDLALVVPPHARSPLLAGLPGQGPLVEVSSGFESAEPGLFVVGDAAGTPLPRAADAAAAGGRTAADAVLARLGLSSEQEPHLPKPECFVGHGGEQFSRISLSYPDGLPPWGEVKITVEGPSRRFAGEFEDAFARWRALRSED